ncbi:MAG: hypothetical protein IAB99_05425 [Bacteroidetes bacterium]|uniref:Uncharacterized protein n=1 Tax=Candidatus Cryptobacteroides faecipullorum TaxID=2840764 RepID=A0A9D9I8N2_9BACT|nr:hypothetical protein [Candidatus Cryptobacteroides faecipullorum]
MEKKETSQQQLAKIQDAALMEAQNKFISACQQAQGLEITDNMGAAFLAANVVNSLRDALTDEVMKRVFMPLMNKKIGFLTDRDPSRPTKDGKAITPYPVDVVRNCIIDAAFIGLLPTGNQFNIIAGVMYPTKEGYTALLKKIGVKYIIQKTPMQDISEKCAAVSCKVSYSFNGENNSFSIIATIKKDSYSSMDQILGKAERKAKKALFEYITGCDFGDADEQSGMPDIDDQTSTQQKVQAKIEKIRNSGKEPDRLL